MRTSLIIGALLLGHIIPATAQNKQREKVAAQTQSATITEVLPIGSMMPFNNVPLMDAVSKRPVMLDSLITKSGLIVMFSCNTCPYVIKSQARTKEIMDFAIGKGVGMVIINSNEAQRLKEDSFEEMVRYAQMQDYKVPYVIDKNNMGADVFGASRTPEIFLFNGSRKLVYKGAMEDNPASPSESKNMYLRDAITSMLEDKPVSPQSTKSIGCSIKRAN